MPNTLTNFLWNDPEIAELKKRYFELTGKHLPPYHWNSYGSLAEYVDDLRVRVREAEKGTQ